MLQVGVAGIVLTRDNKVLGIREASGPTAKLEEFWKLPGGLVDPGEDIHTAVVREVKEETGVSTEFVCVAAARESHQALFGASDIYMVCVLRLVEDVVPAPCPQDREVAEARWLDLDGFLGSKWYAEGLYGQMLKSAAVTAKRCMEGEKELGLSVVRMPSLGGREESMYYQAWPPAIPAKL